MSRRLQLCFKCCTRCVTFPTFLLAHTHITSTRIPQRRHKVQSSLCQNKLLLAALFLVSVLFHMKSTPFLSAYFPAPTSHSPFYAIIHKFNTTAHCCLWSCSSPLLNMSCVRAFSYRDLRRIKKIYYY